MGEKYSNMRTVLFVTVNLTETKSIILCGFTKLKKKSHPLL